MVVLTVDGLILPSNSWVTYIEQTQTMYGVPKPGDVGVHQYIQAAKDAGAILARVSFHFNISERQEVPCYIISKDQRREWDFREMLQSLNFADCISDEDCQF